MTPATRQIIRVALDGDATITTDERDRIMGAINGRRAAKADPDIRTYTAPEVAKMLRTSVSTVARMKRDGKLKTVKVGGWTKICGASLDEFVARRETA